MAARRSGTSRELFRIKFKKSKSARQEWGYLKLVLCWKLCEETRSSSVPLREFEVKIGDKDLK